MFKIYRVSYFDAETPGSLDAVSRFLAKHRDPFRTCLYVISLVYRMRDERTSDRIYVEFCSDEDADPNEVVDE